MPRKSAAEWARFLGAVAKSKVEVSSLRDKARIEAGDEQAAIFESHLLMLDDPDLHERIESALKKTMVNVEKIVVDIEREFADKLGQAEDPTLRERVTDIQDVSRRILGHLLERQRPSLHDLAEDVVLVARDLLPSDMISMNRKRVKAVVTESGGRTSHVAILARAFEIPAVLGVRRGALQAAPVGRSPPSTGTEASSSAIPTSRPSRGARPPRSEGRQAAARARLAPRPARR